jgi:predicted Zn-dependent protease
MEIEKNRKEPKDLSHKNSQKGNAVSKASVRRNFWFNLLLGIILLPFFVEPQSASAQYRKLPKAQFGNYSQSQVGNSPTLTQPVQGSSGLGDSGNTMSLPMSTGLHLSPGLDRKPGAAGAADRYDPGEPTLKMQLVRWESKKMPLLIYLSPGLKLPDCPFESIPAVRPDQVTQMLQNPGNPFQDLTRVKNWVPEMNDQVAAGIEQWREFENEGLFNFAFTEDPHNAHIMIFFTDAFRDANSAGGNMVGGITSAQVYPYALAQSQKIGQKPVIIELSTLVNSTDEKMQASSAHEFGHALGIKAHSPYREDIMYAFRVVNHLSPADKSTIRYLYKTKPQWVL